MARKTVFVSDFSGEPIEEGKGATVRVSFEDGRKAIYEADATEDEALALLRIDGKNIGRPMARRGRKPKTA